MRGKHHVNTGQVSAHNRNMADQEKTKPKPDEETKPPRTLPFKRKVGEPPGNLRKREEWFRKQSGG
jgi:hypothetical protein